MCTADLTTDCELLFSETRLDMNFNFNHRLSIDSPSKNRTSNSSSRLPGPPFLPRLSFTSPLHPLPIDSPRVRFDKVADARLLGVRSVQLLVAHVAHHRPFAALRRTAADAAVRALWTLARRRGATVRAQRRRQVLGLAPRKIVQLAIVS